jgi:hypothetical protein
MVVGRVEVPHIEVLAGCRGLSKFRIGSLFTHPVVDGFLLNTNPFSDIALAETVQPQVLVVRLGADQSHALACCSAFSRFRAVN